MGWLPRRGLLWFLQVCDASWARSKWCWWRIWSPQIKLCCKADHCNKEFDVFKIVANTSNIYIQSFLTLLARWLCINNITWHYIIVHKIWELIFDVVLSGSNVLLKYFQKRQDMFQEINNYLQSLLFGKGEIIRLTRLNWAELTMVQSEIYIDSNTIFTHTSLLRHY